MRLHAREDAENDARDPGEEVDQGTDHDDGEDDADHIHHEQRELEVERFLRLIVDESLVGLILVDQPDDQRNDEPEDDAGQVRDQRQCLLVVGRSPGRSRRRCGEFVSIGHCWTPHCVRMNLVRLKMRM